MPTKARKAANQAKWQRRAKKAQNHKPPPETLPLTLSM
jgi:hypothetical protein